MVVRQFSVGVFFVLACIPCCFVNSQGIEPRIIGGNAADRDTYPNSVVIIADRQEELVCGGTIISPTLILTAAHCARGILDFAHVGRYNRLNPLEQYDSIPIIAERQHPDFDAESLDHDIMLLQLARPPNIEIDYMSVNDFNNMPPVGATLLAMGWGETQPNGSDSSGTPILQEVKLNYVSNSECNEKSNQDEDYRGKITDTMLCTFEDGADHCYGDSGGPILAISPTDPTNVMQVAIISWGSDRCADGVFPGVNQRTSTSYQWLSDWVCVIDGAKDEETRLRYDCQDGQTFSPMPSPAPVPPTISPAPTAYIVNLWVELFMDEWPEDIRWSVVDSDSGLQVASSPSYAGTTDDVIVERVALSPDKSYRFVITDEFGDGFQDGGFYQVSLGGDVQTATFLFSGNLESEVIHTFTTPERTPAPIAPSPLPTTVPSARPTTTPSFEPTTAPNDVPTCSSVGDICSAYTECCSQKCILGECQKSPSPSTNSADGNRFSLADGRGGAAGGAARDNKVSSTNNRYGGVRRL